jgi:hypothetical protein
VDYIYTVVLSILIDIMFILSNLYKIFKYVIRIVYIQLNSIVLTIMERYNITEYLNNCIYIFSRATYIALHLKRLKKYFLIIIGHFIIFSI